MFAARCGTDERLAGFRPVWFHTTRGLIAKRTIIRLFRVLPWRVGVDLPRYQVDWSAFGVLVQQGSLDLDQPAPVARWQREMRRLERGPEYLALRCFACEMFQCIRRTKAKRWECRICREKQSFQRVGGAGAMEGDRG